MHSGIAYLTQEAHVPVLYSLYNHFVLPLVIFSPIRPFDNTMQYITKTVINPLVLIKINMRHTQQ